MKKNAKLNGLPYETAIIRQSPLVENTTVTLAPGQSAKPLSLLGDLHFEELSNPDKYPDGNGALHAKRDVEIPIRRYFNQRLLDVDGRFARSIEYLLSAQYATESKQVHSDINHYVFRRGVGQHFQGERLTVGTVKNIEKMNSMVKADLAYKILKNIRGSPGYFQGLFHDVLAMIRQLGIPTWFFTVSAADMQWPDLIQTIARQYGTKLTDEDVKNLSFQERCNWLKSNPVTAARHFEYRLELLFREVLKSKAEPLGELLDYAVRIEFQARGSPHAHMVLWVKNAPKLGENGDNEICEFIDRYVTCKLPENDEDLKEIVERVQTHSHSRYCKKKGPCRFKFPHPPSPKTLIARELEDDEYSEELSQRSRDVLLNVREALNGDHSTEISTMDDLLEISNVSADQYCEALSVSKRGTNVVLLRNINEQYINAYNPTIIKAWQANIDIQYVIDAYACVMYIASYMTKNESGMGELLKQTLKENSDKDIKSALRRVGTTFLNHREVSAQEAAYRILSMPMKKLSREVVFVTTDKKSERYSVLKPQAQLKGKDEDIFQKSMVTRYESRPNSMENTCFAEFAANYTVSYTEGPADDVVPDLLDDSDLPVPEVAADHLPNVIHLNNRMGCMRKRRHKAVIRFRKYNRQEDTSEFFRAKMMLYLPWRNEEADLLGDFETFEEHYSTVTDVVHANEVQFSQNVDMIDQAVQANNDRGPPEHMWADIAPGTEFANEQDKAEGVVVERDIEQEDLDANAAMVEGNNSGYTTEIGARYQAEVDKDTLSPSEYRKLVRQLNPKQRHVVFYHRRWCKDAIVAIKENRQVTPYRLFLSGPGGVGKSHVIKLIHTDTRKLLPLSNTIKPTDCTVLLTAPTGVAAFNINGMTVHSALLLGVSKYGNSAEHLTSDKLNTLRSKLENLTLIIIDEISMVGSDMLLTIHKRLEDIKGVHGEDVFFGNVCILAVGDLYQLPPIGQPQIYQPARRNPLASIGCSLWKDRFMLHELDEVMRQRDDQSFAELLCRVRVGECTPDDIEILKSREISLEDPDYPKDWLHVFAFNNQVDEWNDKRLRDLAPNDNDRVSIPAIDDKTDSTGLVDLTAMGESRKRSDTGGMHTILVLADGARVMLIYNVDVSDGLVNGVIGQVVAIKRNSRGVMDTILVQFDDHNVGKRAILSSQWKAEYPNAVPIRRHEARFEKANRKGAQISRRQFPLTLAWAITIHKCQGMTMDNIVVSMKGSHRFGKGQAYVAFSRVKTLQGLHITNFDPKGIKTNKDISTEMENMREKSLPLIPKPELLSRNRPEWITVGHLNIRHFSDKLQDLASSAEMELFTHTDVMCFSETYLRDRRNIEPFTEINGYETFFDNVSQERVGASSHGLLICASQRLCPKELPLIHVAGLESKVVVLDTGGSRLVICLIYRKPSLPLTNFLALIETLLNLMPLGVRTIILGDFNENLLSKQQSDLLHLMGQYGFKQLVKQPTTDSGSLLDHIYYNQNESNDEVYVDVHDVYYSDHDATFITTRIR